MLSTKQKSALALLSHYCAGIITLSLVGLASRFFFYIYLNDSFAQLPILNVLTAFYNGLEFDLSIAALAMVLLLIPFWLVSRFSINTRIFSRLIYVLAGALVLSQISDTLYFADAGRHTSYEIYDIANDAFSLFLTGIYQHGLFIITSVLVSIFITLIAYKFSYALLSLIFKKFTYFPYSKILFQHELILIILLFSSVIFIRGGLSGVPHEPLTAFISGNTAQGQITLNGTYNIAHRLLAITGRVTQINVPLPNDLSKKQILNRLDSKTIKPIVGEYKPYNVVIVFLESWQAAQMQSYGGKQNVTPYFDSLRNQSISPNYIFAGGGRTTEGLFSTLCSFQNPLGQTVAQSQLQSFDYYCLPHILKDKGWQTAFFQGSNKNTSGTGIFAQRLGFSDSLGKSSIKSEKYKHNKWGVHDPDLYDFVMQKSQAMSEPFFIGINTTSTHDDELPASIQPKFGMKTAMQRYNSVLNFADDSLKNFITQFNKIKREKPTIFVLISDHTAGRTINELTKTLIPGIIYSHDLDLKQTVNRAVHQRDFAPTLLNLLNMSIPTSFAGASMLTLKNTLWDAEFYNAGKITVINDNALISYNLLNRQKQCYDINYASLDLTQGVCNEEDKAIMKSALGFTHYSQNLLFNGQTRQFNH